MESLFVRLKGFLDGLERDRLGVILGRAALGLLAILFILSGTLLVGFDALDAGNQSVSLAVGQVAVQDIRAPFSISYESAVMSNQARQVAMDSVRDVYDPPDPSIARQQVQLARQILDYIKDVRADEFASTEVLHADIRAISALSLTDDEINALLSIPPDRWADIDDQIMTVLERVMRGEIRDDTLRSVKQNIPNLVSVRFREDEVALVTAIVEDLIKTNTFFNEERTRQARQSAADSVAPEIRSFVQGQLVVRGGSIVTEADMEALTQLGLLIPADRRVQELLSAFLIMLLVTLVFWLYLSRFHVDIARDTTLVILLGGIFILALLGIRIGGPERVVQPYLYPTAALGLLIVTLAGPQVAVMATIGLAILFGIMADGSFPLTLMTTLGGIVGILTLRSTERLNSYFFAGLIVGFANVGIVLVFYLLGSPVDPLGALSLIGAGWLNGILAATVALAGLYLISSLLNVPTSLRLLELMQPNQPLLQRLLREAPGTYQHSLQVSNLAELAAERVGANATLTRVGALYHDVGKMAAPHFFIENQVDGVNPHDSLNDPYKSARIIIEHVAEGDKLVRRYRLPRRLRDFILEHHGTTSPMYFYNRAVQMAGGNKEAVDLAEFTYPGPRPQTRETAILMLADSSESIVRARRPQNKQEIADVIRYIFDLRMQEGQLDDSGLTLNDLSVIQRVFVETLQGVFHPRIAYSPARATLAVEGMPNALPAGTEADPASNPPAHPSQEPSDSRTPVESLEARSETSTP